MVQGGRGWLDVCLPTTRSKAIYTIQMGIWKLSKNDTLEKLYKNNKSFSLLTLPFNAGCNSWIIKASLIFWKCMLTSIRNVKFKMHVFKMFITAVCVIFLDFKSLNLCFFVFLLLYCFSCSCGRIMTHNSRKLTYCLQRYW